MQGDYVCVARNDTIFVRHESSCLQGCTSQVQCAFFRPQSVPRNTPGNSGRGNSDKVGRRGLVPWPVRLSTETKAINKTPSAQLREQLHLRVPVRRSTKLCYLVLTANTGIPDKRATSEHKSEEIQNKLRQRELSSFGKVRGGLHGLQFTDLTTAMANRVSINAAR